ncbi:hypothetical protein [Acinetobacter baumannii]|uniref:hypothetical protein n=1 Tax=Acinetobacter baumannii TaxID=470 RepID=UPI0002BC537C|nr:hypothetical protein [Acinetobacter baumannii]RSP34209.1 hypothetical protein EA732_09550 [Acinetobacter baumannii]
MGWEIPIFHFNVNHKPRILAYLKPLASEANTQELDHVYDLVNNALSEYFNDDDFKYNSEELRLFYLQLPAEGFILWHPEQVYEQERIEFIYGARIPDGNRLTSIDIPEIPQNFPHIFWNKPDEDQNHPTEPDQSS